MNWFKRHLNWVCIFGHLLWFVGIMVYSFAWGMYGIYVEPVMEDMIDNIVFTLLFVVIVIPVSLWVLHQKGRNTWWVLLSGWFSPVWLSNKN